MYAYRRKKGPGCGGQCHTPSPERRTSCAVHVAPAVAPCFRAWDGCRARLMLHVPCCMMRACLSVACCMLHAASLTRGTLRHLHVACCVTYTWHAAGRPGIESRDDGARIARTDCQPKQRGSHVPPAVEYSQYLRSVEYSEFLQSVVVADHAMLQAHAVFKMKMGLGSEEVHAAYECSHRVVGKGALPSLSHCLPRFRFPSVPRLASPRLTSPCRPSLRLASPRHADLRLAAPLLRYHDHRSESCVCIRLSAVEARARRSRPLDSVR